MDTLAKLNTYQKHLFREIEKAAAAGDVPTMLGLQGKFATAEKLIQEEKDIIRRVEALVGGPAMLAVVNAAPQAAPPGSSNSQPSAKEYGRRRRSKFVKEAESRGIVLQQVTSTIYATPEGTRVGIASATEGENGDRWFLDLPEGKFDHAVLLCEGLNGDLTHFSLPKKVMDQYGHDLSRTKGRVKFNVHRRGGKHVLLIPNHGPVNVEAYRDNFSGLR
jgi:hypothetical protein